MIEAHLKTVFGAAVVFLVLSSLFGTVAHFEGSFSVTLGPLFFPVLLFCLFFGYAFGLHWLQSKNQGGDTG